MAPEDLELVKTALARFSPEGGIWAPRSSWAGPARQEGPGTARFPGLPGRWPTPSTRTCGRRMTSGRWPGGCWWSPPRRRSPWGRRHL